MCTIEQLTAAQVLQAAYICLSLITLDAKGRPAFYTWNSSDRPEDVHAVENFLYFKQKRNQIAACISSILTTINPQDQKRTIHTHFFDQQRR